MAFCSHCGAKLAENQRFCSECGSAQNVGAPAAAPKPPVQRPVQSPNPTMQRPVQSPNPTMQRPAQSPNPTMQRPGQGYNPAAQRPVQSPNPAMQRPVQSANPAMQRPAQPVNQGGGHEYTTYISKPGAAASEQTTYIPKRPDAAPQQSYTPPQQSYTPPQQSYTPPQQSYTPPQQNYTIPEPPAGAQPGITMGAGKKSGKGKAGIIVLILVLLAALGVGAFFLLKDGFGSGGKATGADVDPAVLGVYGAVDEDGNEIKGEWLELKEKAKGELRLDGEKYNFKWELDGEDLTIIQAKDEYTGTLIDGEIILDINGDIFTYRHEDWTPSGDDAEDPEDDAEEPAPPAETAAPEMPAEEDATDPNTLAFWEGDYYGWWIINEVYEGDAYEKEEWWDCFANVSFNRDGTAWVTIWDENGSRSEPMGEVKMDISLVDYGVVEFTSLSGGFGGCDIEYGQWYCRSDDDTDYDQTFWFSATYNDGDGLHFDYTFYMRPWGHDWKDIAQNDPALLPGNYENWYLPLIESGVERAPDYIS